MLTFALEPTRSRRRAGCYSLLRVPYPGRRGWSSRRARAHERAWPAKVVSAETLPWLDAQCDWDASRETVTPKERFRLDPELDAMLAQLVGLKLTRINVCVVHRGELQRHVDCRA